MRKNIKNTYFTQKQGFSLRRKKTMLVPNVSWEWVHTQIEARPPPAGVTGEPGATQVVRETQNSVLRLSGVIRRASASVRTAQEVRDVTPCVHLTRWKRLPVSEPQRREKTEQDDEWQSGWWLNVECVGTVVARGQRGKQTGRRINQAAFKEAFLRCRFPGGWTAWEREREIGGESERGREKRAFCEFNNYYCRRIMLPVNVRVWINGAMQGVCGS